MECNNGQTKEARRGLEVGNSTNESSRLGETKVSSLSDGTNQIRPFNQDCSGRDYSGSTIQGNDSPGKILERLKLIENKHLFYLQGDKQYLEARLDQNKNEEEAFKRSVQELEQEIYKLISEEGKSLQPIENQE
ncbi:hypothetical protein LC613_13735 [Nostoc sphaeroides CHAB 2801]|uniref:hypothetical protein n=1 Tax=Nostoc sphaeroides TaxID=446679 RepID=UPI000E4B7C3C|nr:hypothetical protein [Nostoc sphaeroides]MCC5629077.1 hypothetical protein [Nostoc sphaeroides CHAB 2801]